MPGLHHFGRVVGDMDRALTFYRDLLGLEEIVDESLSGPEVEAQVMIEGADLRTVMLGSPPDGPMLELIAYRSPPSRPHPGTARLDDVGNDHPCLLVDDIHDAYERLRTAGVRFSCPPQYVDGGHFEGDWVTYCFDPDGLTVELWQSARR